MSNLIAVVATAVIVDGERVVIQPGERLPDLSKHDAKALQETKLALDPRLTEEAAAAANAAALAAAANFQSARELVKDEIASTKETGTTSADDSEVGKGGSDSSQADAAKQAKAAGQARGSSRQAR